LCPHRRAAVFQRRLYGGKPHLQRGPGAGHGGRPAVIDSAYGPEARTPIAMRREFVEAVRPFAEEGQPVLFPVPRYGRGPEILYLLARRWPAAPLYGDETFRRQLDALAADPCWVQPAARSFLRSVTVQPLPDAPPREGFAF